MAAEPPAGAGDTEVALVLVSWHGWFGISEAPAVTASCLATVTSVVGEII